MNLKRSNLKIRRDIKIWKSKANSGAKKIGIKTRAQAKKIKKNLPKYQKKAGKRGKRIEAYFTAGIPTRIDLY